MLLHAFQDEPYPDSSTFANLAALSGLQKEVIQRWFTFAQERLEMYVDNSLLAGKAAAQTTLRADAQDAAVQAGLHMEVETLRIPHADLPTKVGTPRTAQGADTYLPMEVEDAESSAKKEHAPSVPIPRTWADTVLIQTPLRSQVAIPGRNLEQSLAKPAPMDLDSPSPEPCPTLPADQSMVLEDSQDPPPQGALSLAVAAKVNVMKVKIRRRGGNRWTRRKAS
ncbi:hypothetical protein BKA61DRAFT_656567 [Leptodontidium sp. MPI-SDFR-AT-0119]|nr:hypothetical protein BKA61DRAFT_656567 [Leptodontidium sp. MPI-SDFR-AT-0119]